MKKLTEEEIERELDQLSGWKRIDEKWIRKRYKCDNYLNGVNYVNKIAEYAEGKNHHPNIAIDYKVVTLKISSWEMQGLTDLDFEMVKHFDELYESSQK